MHVGLIADPHLINPNDSYESRLETRQHFAEAWPSFRTVIEELNAAAVDHVIILGDLVDYYTDANRDFALSLLEDLEMPWHLTPGNHDYAVPTDESGSDTEHDQEAGRCGYAASNVEISDRVLDLDDVRFILLDSALSAVADDARSWLDSVLDNDRACVLCTHVPLDVDPVVEAIHAVEPDRNLEKYVQRGSPELYETTLAGRVDLVCSGHLHFPARATIDETVQLIRPKCIRTPHTGYETDGTIATLDTADLSWTERQIPSHDPSDGTTCPPESIGEPEGA